MEYEIINHNNKAKILCYTVTASTHMMHFHHEYELLYILKGHINVQWDMRVTELGQHQMFLLESDEMHDVYSSDPDNIILVLQFHPDFYENFCPALREKQLKHHFLYPSEGILYHAIRACIADIVRLHCSLSSPELFRPIRTICEIFILLMEQGWLIPNNEMRSAKANEMKDRLARIVDFVNTHYSFPITLKEIATREGVSFYYLSHFIRTHLNMSFQDYLTRIRLYNASFMVANSGKSLSAISQECGFSDLRYMKKAFQREYGCSPSEYAYKSSSKASIQNINGFPSQGIYSTENADAAQVLKWLTMKLD